MKDDVYTPIERTNISLKSNGGGSVSFVIS